MPYYVNDLFYFFIRASAPRLRRTLVRTITAAFTVRNACNRKDYLPPPCVNYVGQNGNAVLPPFEKTRPVYVTGKRRGTKRNHQSQPRPQPAR